MDIVTGIQPALYPAADHQTWRRLYKRQMDVLPGRACDEFMDGLEKIDIADGIPDFARLSKLLLAQTGWQIVSVGGLVPDEIFFEYLAQRRFPATWWIRKPEELDYTPAPDVFHDIFGHVPLLINPVFAAYMEAYGKAGVAAAKLGATKMLARLYWYATEFGLIETPGGLRIYGSGIVSSPGESVFSLEDEKPGRFYFEPARVMRTRYEAHEFQKTYFVIRDFRQLPETLRQDLPAFYRRLEALPEFASDAAVAGDLPYAPGAFAAAAPDPAVKIPVRP